MVRICVFMVLGCLIVLSALFVALVFGFPLLPLLIVPLLLAGNKA